MGLTPDSIAQPGAEPSLWQYDPSRIVAVWNGLILSGYADGTFIDIERRKPAFEIYVGTTGAAARCRTRDDTAKATITLLAQAPVNELLIVMAYDDANDWQGVSPFKLKDLNGSIVAFAVEAWPVKVPKVTRSKQADVMVWEFAMSDFDVIATPGQ